MIFSRDFFQWTQQQAESLKKGHWAEGFDCIGYASFVKKLNDPDFAT